MIAMACLLPSSETTTEAEKLVMAARNAARSTGGFGNTALPSILSCTWVKRDTNVSDGKRRKSNKAFSFFSTVVIALHLLSVWICTPAAPLKVERHAAGINVSPHLA